MREAARRNFLKTLAATAMTGLGMAAKGEGVLALVPTPAETAGPFYPIYPQKDTDFDLTRIAGKTGAAQGQVIWIEGGVVDTADSPVAEATVEIWQANAAGRYHHPHDSNSAPLDPNFQGWAIVQTGKEGTFRFKTVMPGAYPAASNWIRPPHIHFKVSKRGYQELITQMYFPQQPLNDTDLLLLRKTQHEQGLMIASRSGQAPETYSYRIVLPRA